MTATITYTGRHSRLYPWSGLGHGGHYNDIVFFDDREAIDRVIEAERTSGVRGVVLDHGRRRRTPRGLGFLASATTRSS